MRIHVLSVIPLPAMMKRYLDDRVTTLLIGNQSTDIFLLSDELDKRFFGAD